MTEILGFPEWRRDYPDNPKDDPPGDEYRQDPGWHDGSKRRHGKHETHVKNRVFHDKSKFTFLRLESFLESLQHIWCKY